MNPKFQCFLLLVLLGIGCNAFAQQQPIRDCTKLLDDLRIKCMKENKKICENITDDLKQDRCMKNLEGNPTKMM